MNILVNRAYEFAKDAHKGQRYGNDLPFIVHPQRVVEILMLFGVTNSELLAAAWLHDVLEDTPYTYDDICDYFGIVVADMVGFVTDKPGENRRIRQEATYSELIKWPHSRLIKIADRTSNVLACLTTNETLLGMYRKEHELFHTMFHDGSMRYPNVNLKYCKIEVEMLWCLKRLIN